MLRKEPPSLKEFTLHVRNSHCSPHATSFCLTFKHITVPKISSLSNILPLTEETKEPLPQLVVLNESHHLHLEISLYLFLHNLCSIQDIGGVVFTSWSLQMSWIPFPSSKEHLLDNFSPGPKKAPHD